MGSTIPRFTEPRTTIRHGVLTAMTTHRPDPLLTDSEATSCAGPGLARDAETAGEVGDRVEEIRRLIELIRPAIQSDGGDLEFVRLTGEGVVEVRLHGACVGCPSSSITLQAGVERTLRERVAGVLRVEAV